MPDDRNRRRPGGWRRGRAPGTFPTSNDHAPPFPAPPGARHEGHDNLGEVHEKPGRGVPTPLDTDGGLQNDAIGDSVLRMLHQEGLLTVLKTVGNHKARIFRVGSLHEFMTRLPPMSMTPWARTVAVQGSALTVAAGHQFNDFLLERVPTKEIRLIDHFSWSWLFDEDDPLNPLATAPTNDYYASGVGVGVNLAVTNSSIFGVHETLTDGAGTTRQQGGFSILNQNILDHGGGNGPVMAYVPQGIELNARVVYDPGTIPVFIAPDQIRFEVRGWALQASSWNLLEQLKAT